MYGIATRSCHRCPRKALLAGLVAGIVGTAVKTISETISPPRLPGQESPLGAGIRILHHYYTGHDLDPETKKTAEQLTHWAFGIATTMGYAVIAEFLPVVTIGWGLGFAFAFWLGAHEIILPLMGWSPGPGTMTLWEQGNELVSHCFYGVSAELVRRHWRRRTMTLMEEQMLTGKKA